LGDGDISGFWFWANGLFGIALMVVFAVVARAVWPRIERTDGIELKRDDAPELLDFIDDVRLGVGKPRLHRVIVTNRMEAGIQQIPRLGYFGWYRNELVLGLPLLLSLTKQEVGAIVAHEFAHLSGSSDRLGAWVYRSRIYMAQVLHDIEEKGRLGSWPFLLFYRWYQPLFAAYSFAVARKLEYEADKVAAELASPQAMIDALARIAIANDYIRDVFWNEIWQVVGKQPEPTKLVYGKLGVALVTLAKWGGAAESFNRNREGRTDYSDTHPSMSDRAQALGVAARVPPIISDAAAWLLPNDGAQLVVAFSERWQADVAEEWTEHYTEIRSRAQRLAALDEAATKGALSDADALERGALAETFIDTEAALVRYEQAMSWTENKAAPLYEIARILLKLRRDEGLVCLKQVIELDDDSIVPACKLAETYLNELDRGAEAADFVRRREAHEKLLANDRADRSEIGRADRLFSHECGEEKLEEIERVIGIARKKGLRRAWMVRKATKHRDWATAYFLVCDFGSYRRSEEEVEEIRTEMIAGLEGQTDVTVLLCDPDERWLPTKVNMVANAKVFPR